VKKERVQSFAEFNQVTNETTVIFIIRENDSAKLAAYSKICEPVINP
jgi:hypothetical protein